jgi:hypothetical protein
LPRPRRRPGWLAKRYPDPFPVVKGNFSGRSLGKVQVKYTA